MMPVFWCWVELTKMLATVFSPSFTCSTKNTRSFCLDSRNTPGVTCETSSRLSM